MPKFQATVVAKIPTYLQAEVTVEAASTEDAERIIREMYAGDELDFSDPTPDYDGAAIIAVNFDAEGVPEPQEKDK